MFYAEEFSLWLQTAMVAVGGCLYHELLHFGHKCHDLEDGDEDNFANDNNYHDDGADDDNFYLKDKTC